MEKTYNPKQIEQHWSSYWQEHQFAKPSQNPKVRSYCVMLPPPNITGTLHMGHGFQQTIMDALIRKHRMQGDNTLWQGGTDHAGISTQMVVERQLSLENKTRHDLGRETFIERVWEWRSHYGNLIVEQMHRLGLSIDWSKMRFSMDEKISAATTESFLRLYEDGLIYKGKRLVNWDPVLHTAVSDLEVESELTQGNLWHIRYPLANPTSEISHIIVATTRPETLLGDVAVAVHPDDVRYQALIGQTVKLPLTDREIPVIADNSVDPQFGTGCVKITPAHDFNDYATGQRHQLPSINIFTLDAKLNQSVPEKYRGLTREVARKQIVKDLEQLQLLEKTENYQLSVPKSERSRAIIEPMLTDQWYVKMSSLAKLGIEAVERGELTFVPDKWKKTYLQWLENIQDWCISRQIWWGHRIPIWYDEKEQIYAGYDETDVRQRYQLPQDLVLRQETDVLDTWFSASLWPFATLGWPEETVDFKTFYPTQVLVTGFDIIFFWVARMVMMGMKLTGHSPFAAVYITGLIRDQHGKKMSKTKGNVIDPIDLIDGIDLESLIKKRCAAVIQPKLAQTIEKETRKMFPQGIPPHGTDALRFTFCALASTGRDINFDMKRLAGYRNFCNKIWNAARFVLMHTENQNLNIEITGNNINFEKIFDFKNTEQFTLADQWIVSRLQQVIHEVNDAFNEYRFDLLAQTLYEFIWNEYCDWYLELAKCVLSDPKSTKTRLRGTRITLIVVLETLLRLLHPLMPFITEEIWQAVKPIIYSGSAEHLKYSSIMLAEYPKSNSQLNSPTAESWMQWLQKIIVNIRTIRSEVGISPAQSIKVILAKGSKADKQNFSINHAEKYLVTLAKISELRWLREDESFEKLSANIGDNVGELEIHIPIQGLINPEIEITRLNKEIEKLKKEHDQINRKLLDPAYLQNARPENIAEQKERFAEINRLLERLGSYLNEMKGLRCLS